MEGSNSLVGGGVITSALLESVFCLLLNVLCATVCHAQFHMDEVLLCSSCKVLKAEYCTAAWYYFFQAECTVSCQMKLRIRTLQICISILRAPYWDHNRGEPRSSTE